MSEWKLKPRIYHPAVYRPKSTARLRSFISGLNLARSRATLLRSLAAAASLVRFAR
jgi:hypothetical protein